MIIAFWIALAGILGAIGVLVVAIARSARLPRWGTVPTDQLQRVEVSLDGETGVASRAFVYSSDVFGDRAMPGMILLPEQGAKHPSFEHWAAMLALQGYPTIAVELARAGTGGTGLVEAVASAIPACKDVLARHANVDMTRVGILGFGEPALAGLVAAGTDPAITIVACAAMPRAGDGVLRAVRGKVVLVHCKDDAVVPLDGFQHNKDGLGLGIEEYLLLDLGGHGFLGQEAVIAGYLSIPIKKALQPRHKQFTPAGVIDP